MLTSDFDFDLPDELVPARPRRGASRLMLVPEGAPSHHAFQELEQLLQPGDLLVLNNTKVLKARLRGHRLLLQPDAEKRHNNAAEDATGDSTGREQVDGERMRGGAVEALMIEPVAMPDPAIQRSTWRAMLRPGKRQRPGQKVELAKLVATVTGRQGDLFTLEFEASEPDVLAAIEAHGELPLPPYLGRTADARDEVDYQTVYAAEPGAVAAPTAGLHFDQSLLDSLEERGIGNTKVTLHVGPGTFRPVKADDVSEHIMDAERYVISAEAAAAINQTKSNGGRVVAVGTTVTRTLEAAGAQQAENQTKLVAASGRTDLFIVPGHTFRVIDGLITNFHLPRSTLLMLVSALVGRKRLLAAYQEAVQHRYHFYSYGDAMLLWPPKASVHRPKTEP